MALDEAGNVDVTDQNNNTIRKVTSTGVVTTLAGSATFPNSADGQGIDARFSSPSSLAVDGSGNIFVTDTNNHTIRKVSSSGLVTTIGGIAARIGWETGIGSAARFIFPKGITVTANGKIFISDYENNRVVQGELAGFQPMLTQGGASILTPSSVTLNGTVNPNGFVTTASFEYGLTSTYGSSASVTLSPSNGTTAQNVSAALTGLSPATLYYYRLTASNVDGTTSTSGGTLTTMSAMSTNADLSGLTLSSGTLSPTFASATISYMASVTNATASISVTPTSAQANATLEVKVDGGTYAAVSSGSPSSLLSLDVGSNTIDVRVTAQDGVTQKTYSLVVTRLPSTNANLSGLTLSIGTLSPAFASATSSYAASVDNVTASITVTSIQAQADASLAVRVNSGAYAAVISGSPSSALSLNVGNNTIDVRVTAQDGVTQKIYTVQLTVSPPTIPSGSIASWRQQHFGSDQNSGNAADLAAPDGDGIPNLVKYALLMTPGQNGSTRLPQAEMTGTSGSRRLTLTFQRDPSRSDVSIVVEAQSGLGGTWSEIARSTNGADFTGSAAVSETSAAGGAKSVTVQDVQVDASRRFMRVRVER